MVTVTRYTPDHRTDWNRFIDESLNSTFMFKRDYMDYHSNLTSEFETRFHDHSLLFYDDTGQLVSVFPANEDGHTLESHGGLTFGGFLHHPDRHVNARDLVVALENYVSKTGLSKVWYKAIPSIYYVQHDDGAVAELHRRGAELSRRDISSVVDLTSDYTVKRSRRQCIDNARENGFTVRETDEWSRFWEILEETLARHDTTPVHSLDEMQYLANHVPNHIKLYGCYGGGELLAGAVVYESQQVARPQYNATSERGRETSANDFLYSELLQQYEVDSQTRYFDFGISTENGGEKLNEGLAFYKESFGATSHVHDFYRWSVYPAAEQLT